MVCNSIISSSNSVISATTNNVVIIGCNDITASDNNMVYVPEIKLNTIGGGVILIAPNGTSYKVTVNNSGVLVVT